MQEAQRIIDESPYLTHLGLRPPKQPFSIRLVAGLGGVWIVGLFLFIRIEGMS